MPRREKKLVTLESMESIRRMAGVGCGVCEQGWCGHQLLVIFAVKSCARGCVQAWQACEFLRDTAAKASTAGGPDFSRNVLLSEPGS